MKIHISCLDEYSIIFEINLYESAYFIFGICNTIIWFQVYILAPCRDTCLYFVGFFCDFFVFLKKNVKKKTKKLKTLHLVVNLVF